MNLSRLLKYSSYDDVVYVTYDLIKQMGVKVTIASVSNEIEQHPSYPSILSISDTLTLFGIESITANIPFDTLLQLPAPFLSIIKNKTGYEEPVLVRAVKDNHVEIMRSADRKNVVIETNTFKNQYLGIALIPDTPARLAENDYDQKVTSARRDTSSLLIALAMVPVLILAFGIFSFYLNGINAVPLIAFTTISFIGCMVSCMLAIYENNQNDRLLNRFCTGSKNIDCNAVLNSPASKIFGIGWSSIGFIFFAGQLLICLFLSGATFSSQYIIGFLSLLAVPYPLFSIFYQLVFVKQWCTLCLVVQVAIIAQFLIVYFSSWIDLPAFFNIFISFPLTSISTISAFSIPGVIYYFSIPNIATRRRMIHYKNELQRLKHDPLVFDSLLDKQNPADFSICSAAIQIGNNNTNVKILMVCSPFCKPCAKAHKALHSFLRAGLDFQLNILFLVDPTSPQPVKKTVAHLYAACHQQPALHRQEVLHAWYAQDHFDFDSFALRFPVAHEPSAFDIQINAVSKWCDQMDIDATPTIFIDGFRLPKSYFADDLKYYFLRETNLAGAALKY